MNQAQFAGHLGKDAVLRSTPSGHSVLNFSIAIAVGFGDKEKTLWVTCALWGERAEKLEPYMTKGKAVTVAGDVDFRTYETKDGRFGGELMCNVQRLTLQGGKKDEERAAPPGESEAPASRARSADDEFGDEIPF